jgi:hypothetical protein
MTKDHQQHGKSCREAFEARTDTVVVQVAVEVIYIAFSCKAHFPVPFLIHDQWLLLMLVHDHFIRSS